MTPRLRSLLWKLVLPVPIAAAIGLLAAWVFLPEQIRENARANATESAADIVSQYKTIRGYYTRNVIKKVVADGNLFPTYDHRDDPGAIPLPATFVHDISELLSKENTSIKLYSAHPFPNRAERKLDDFQQAAWDFLSRNPDDRFTRLEMQNGNPVMRVAIADKMVAPACVDCHNGRPDTPKADWKLGDVRGVLEVATGIGPALARGEALSNTVMVAVAVFSLALAGITVVSARSVSNPIKGMTAALDRLAAGDTSAEIPYQNKFDEIGAMAKSAEIFKENALAREKLESERAETHEAERKRREERRFQLANEFEERVGTVTASVLSAANQLRSSASSLARGTESVADHASSVSTAAEQSTQAVTAVSGTTGDLNQSISEIAAQVHKSTDMAVAAVKAIEETNTKVQGLVDAAEEIGNVVSLINDIAEQTNLLALNATIEAARAGEAGKGFAVVASEVKNLAGQTGKATNEIESQMGDIQAATKDAVTAIESIARIISELDGVSAAVSAAVEEQSASVKTIAESTGHASDGANQVMSGITGVTSTAENTHAQAQEMLEAASSLSADVEGLQSQVGKFVETIRSS